MVEYSQTGNLTKNSGGYRFFYDRANQLTRIEDSSNNAVASYAYDALGRRIERVDEKASATLRFYYTGQRIIEDTDGSDTVQRHYVWGNYIDELLLMRTQKRGRESYLTLGVGWIMFHGYAATSSTSCGRIGLPCHQPWCGPDDVV